jgi:hypothetical protein
MNRKKKGKKVKKPEGPVSKLHPVPSEFYNAFWLKVYMDFEYDTLNVPAKLFSENDGFFKTFESALEILQNECHMVLKMLAFGTARKMMNRMIFEASTSGISATSISEQEIHSANDLLQEYLRRVEEDEPVVQQSSDSDSDDEKEDPIEQVALGISLREVQIGDWYVQRAYMEQFRFRVNPFEKNIEVWFHRYGTFLKCF